MDPVDVESVSAKWGLDVYVERDDENAFEGKRALISLLSWFDYCDQLVKVAHPLAGRALAHSIRQNFLEPILEPLLLQTSEIGILTSTALLTKLVAMASCPALLHQMSHFILGEDGERAEQPQDLTQHILRRRFIDRCDHLCDEISLISLKLFEVLLQKPDQHIIQNLVLRNLESRAYYGGGLPPLGQGPPSPARTQPPESPPSNSEGAAAAAEELSGSQSRLSDAEEANETELPARSNALGESVTQPPQPPPSNSEGAATVVEGLPGSRPQPSRKANETELLAQSNAVGENGDVDQRQTSEKTGGQSGNGLLPDSQSDSGVSLTLPLGSPGGVGSQSGVPSSPGAESDTSLLCLNGPESPPPESPTSTFDPEESQPGIHKIVNCFLCLVPDYAKSSPLGDGGYETYLREAHRQFRELSVHCLAWDWPTHPRAIAGGQEEAPPFFEGLFLKVLFDKLARMLDQPYEVNLQVTSVLSKVALYPHPHIHEFLLDPYLQLRPQARSLYSVLTKLVGELKMRSRSMVDFQQQVLLVRRQLMEMNDDNRTPEVDLMEAVIVLEEFAKELAAVAFVKAHAKSGGGQI